MNQPPRYIYLQCYDEDGEYIEPVADDVTWCVERINETDAEYILLDKDTYWTLIRAQIEELIAANARGK